MHIYFMRHGQTNYNILGLCNDDPTSAVHLDETGIRQSERAAKQLARAAIERIIVSELPRTQQTAEIVNRYHHVPITVQPAINDLRTGMNGLPAEQHRRAIAADPMNTRVDAGETLAEHKHRIHGFIEWLRGQPDQVLLVVAHEETLRAVMAYFEELSDEEMRAIEVGNAEIIEVEI